MSVNAVDVGLPERAQVDQGSLGFVVIADFHRALVRRQKAEHMIQQDGFPAPRPADDGDEIASVKGEVDTA